MGHATRSSDSDCALCNHSDLPPHSSVRLRLRRHPADHTKSLDGILETDPSITYAFLLGLPGNPSRDRLLSASRLSCIRHHSSFVRTGPRMVPPGRSWPSCLGNLPCISAGIRDAGYKEGGGPGGRNIWSSSHQS